MPIGRPLTCWRSTPRCVINQMVMDPTIEVAVAFVGHAHKRVVASQCARRDRAAGGSGF